MFTGLIQATGTLVAARRLATGIHIEVDAQGLRPRPIAVGDSIAVNGVCLTATDVAGYRFGADVSLETLSKTTGLDAALDPAGASGSGVVNLETALALGDKLGGHLVSGHVDGVGTVVGCAPAGESLALVVRAPAALARYLAVKGSLAVDGVSLTINRVDDGADAAGACDVHINLIPHTVAATGFRDLAPGRRVNLEIDLIARYVARMMELPGAT
jgi:riboflavin synthase